MIYFLLIHDEESIFDSLSEAEMGQFLGEYEAFGKELEASGVAVAGHRLQPVATATSVQVRDGKTLHTDGPFAETKEQLGGFYAIDVPDLDAALSWAAKVPSARFGTIEVRPEWA